MTGISTASITIQATTTEIQSARKQCDSAQAGGFNALFSMFSATESSSQASSSSSSSSGLGQSNGSISSIFDIFLSENSSTSSASNADSSNFSTDFTNAFGTAGGPLFDWLNSVSSALHLTPDQNAALQKIAVEHKDTNGSGGDVQAISAELSAAGIA